MSRADARQHQTCAPGRRFSSRRSARLKSFTASGGLPAGRRRNELEAAVLPILVQDFAGRILPFDSASADADATIAVTRRTLGRPISQSDAQIAAIAVSHGAAIATRNVADFADVGVPIINPWGGD